MSEHRERHHNPLLEEHHHESLLDQWGTVSVIIYGLLFLTLLVSLNPTW
jgi:hypothetical protein